MSYYITSFHFDLPLFHFNPPFHFDLVEKCSFTWGHAYALRTISKHASTHLTHFDDRRNLHTS